MRIAIAGGSGFVGAELKRQLNENGHQVVILTRSRERAKEPGYVQWLEEGCIPEKHLGEVDAFVNLAGDSINGLRWTKAKKKRILQSRMDATREVIRIFAALERKPEVLINASAVGYYGMSETARFTEQDRPAADDFLANVVREWEEEAAKAEPLGIRTVFARLGIVLGDGGALPLMALPYKLGAGGTIGSGRQWISWIQVADAAGLIRFAIENSRITGPLNLTAPQPVRMQEFGKMLGNVLHRPHWLPVPAPVLKLLLGEMNVMLTAGQCAIPKKAAEHGYSYQYPVLGQALEKSLQ